MEWTGSMSSRDANICQRTVSADIGGIPTDMQMAGDILMWSTSVNGTSTTNIMTGLTQHYPGDHKEPTRSLGMIYDKTMCKFLCSWSLLQSYYILTIEDKLTI